ncbi:MAG TPA: tetratricopeptide repeat protein, partial [Pirellulales bacterium]|nr:tetratricopeptide repeat protein [Pirellulales bacterium]
MQLGIALRGVGRFPDAARLYRGVLDKDPENADAFLGLLRSLAGDGNIEDIGPRFAKLQSPRENFDICAADCDRRQIPQLLEALAQAMRKIDADYAPIDYFLALAKVRAQETDKAVTLFKSALAKQPNARLREDYTQGFLKAMAAAGKYADAYTVAPDSGAAFRLLAAEAVKGYRNDELKKLVAAHAKQHADDPLLPLYQAEVQVRDGRYALAVKTFAAALAKPPDDETLRSFRGSRVLALYHTGEGMAAYRDVGPRQETFTQLADLMLLEENDAELTALLDAHAKNEPESLDGMMYRCRLSIRQGRTEEGVRLFKKVLEKKPPDKTRSNFLYEFCNEMAVAGKSVAAYEAAPDDKGAFRTLAECLSEEGRLEDLPELLTAHRQRQPDDPWLAYYQGDIHLAAEEWDKAAQVLGEGMKKAPKEVKDSLWWKYVLAMYKAGRGLQAYEQTEPKEAAFTQLANLLIEEKKGGALATLVEAHRAQAADAAELLSYEAVAMVLERRPEDAAA